MQNKSHKTETFSHGDAVDTGQYGAARREPSDPENHERVFANFRVRLHTYLKELDARVSQ